MNWPVSELHLTSSCLFPMVYIVMMREFRFPLLPGCVDMNNFSCIYFGTEIIKFGNVLWEQLRDKVESWKLCTEPNALARCGTGVSGRNSSHHSRCFHLRWRHDQLPCFEFSENLIGLINQLLHYETTESPITRYRFSSFHTPPPHHIQDSGVQVSVSAH
jgi:hypothetical protein